MEAESPLKSCVIFPGALGDFVCFLPALALLAHRAEVDLIARSEFAEIVPENVRVRSIESYPISRLFSPGATEDERVLRFFRQYFGVYSWHGSRSADLCHAVKSIFPKSAWIFPFYPPRSGLHQADYFLSCVSDAQRKAVPAIRIDPDAIAWATDYVQTNGLRTSRLLGLAPGSGAPEKNWRADYFAQIARWWREDIHGTAVAFLGPAEEHRRDLDRLRENATVIGNLSVGRLAALLRHLDLYIGNDSGVTHLAAAVGVPTVALFGPTAVSEWAPRGSQVTVVSQNVECSPCSHVAMRSCGHRRCLQTLEPGKVIESAKAVLACANLTRREAATTV